MLEVVTVVQVKPEASERFAQAAHTHALQTMQEEASVAFEVLQQIDDPAWFVLLQKYHSEEGWTAHLATPHRKHFDAICAEVVVDGGANRLCQSVVREVLEVDDLPR